MYAYLRSGRRPPAALHGCAPRPPVEITHTNNTIIVNYSNYFYNNY